MITEDEPSYHLVALYRRLSARPHRILYVGLDLKLMKYLEKSLEDCWLVRAPAGCVARHFIEKLNHSLILLDDLLLDGTGLELIDFIRSVERTKQTPVILLSDRKCKTDVVITEPDDYEKVARTIAFLMKI